jgi:hypothetical protein
MEGGLMAFKGVRCKKSVALTGQNVTTPAAVTWDTEEFDVGGWHDTGSDTSRITVPSGVSQIQLFGCIRLANHTGDVMMTVEIKKNGNSLTPTIRNQNRVSNVTNKSCYVASPPLIVTAGDYFELFVGVASDTSVDIGTGSFFSAMEMPISVSFSGCLAKKSADQTTADYTTLTQIAFNSEEYDVTGWHDTVTNNTRLTVPSGVSYVNLIGRIGIANFSAIGTNNTGGIKKDGTTRIVDFYFDVGSATNSPAWGCFTGPIAVSAGAYFELEYQCVGDSSITVTASETHLSALAVG